MLCAFVILNKDYLLTYLSRYTATETHMSHGITQCYLPPGRGDIPALTPVKLVFDLASTEGCKAELI